MPPGWEHALARGERGGRETAETHSCARTVHANLLSSLRFLLLHPALLCSAGMYATRRARLYIPANLCPRLTGHQTLHWTRLHHAGDCAHVIPGHWDDGFPAQPKLWRGWVA